MRVRIRSRFAATSADTLDGINYAWQPRGRLKKALLRMVVGDRYIFKSMSVNEGSTSAFAHMDTKYQRRSIAVLIVEDEPLIRMDACSLIEEAGFTVYEAKDADEAIRLLESNDEVGLIFTDIQMPGSMDGLALARYVRDHWPPVKIIVTSGQIKAQREDLPAGAIFVPKPYGSSDLASRVKELVAG